MVTRVLIHSGSYHDSVTLMTLSQRVAALPGITEAVAVMGTPMNRELLENVGLLTPEAVAAGPSDLVIAVAADTDAHATAATAAAEEMLKSGGVAGRGTGHRAGRTPGADGSGGSGAGGSTGSGAGIAATPGTASRTIAAAVRANPAANLAFISVPGPYAAREARLAIEQNLDVMLYSDNVPLADEVRLKLLAHDRGLLLMGPDCGTAIIDGVGLGFANAVRRGNIGIVAASGTGAQELSCLIDRLGAGIAMLIGTGGRDGSAAVGGRMLLDGLARLQADPESKVIVIIAKPPAPAVTERLRAAAGDGSKPVVFCFLNGDGGLTIDDAAVRAVHLATGEPEAELMARLGDRTPGRPLAVPGQHMPASGPPPGAVSPARTDVHGLFAGGSLCEQARVILSRSGHPSSLLDLGDDAFTTGRPHPMIDPTLRRRKLREAVAEPQTAVILLDIILGYGAHSDPAGALAAEIREAADRGIAVVVSVTGTEADPQGLSAQAATLRAAGAAVLPTARLAAEYVLEVMARG